MKIDTVQLKSFRRFTDLIITGLPTTARLVVLCGPNGCGKSSLFDGMKVWHAGQKGSGRDWREDYYVKKAADGEAVLHSVKFHGGDLIGEALKKALYFRSAYRNDPEFKLSQLNSTGSALDENRFHWFIQNDAAVSINYQRLASQAFAEVFEKYDPKKTVGEFRRDIIGNLQASIARVFPDLKLNALGDPLKEGTFFFDKGATKRFDYKNLSGGEKAAFDLILDMVVKSKEFNDTVFCIDEPELHMNSRLQGRLLDELFNLAGDKGQLWISTHSIGMMRAARELWQSNPEEVVFLDFHDVDFDKPAVLEPVTPDRAFWGRVLSVALDDLAELVMPRQVVICEGASAGMGARANVAHDAACFNDIFAMELPDALFIPGGNSHEISGDKFAIMSAIQAISGAVDVVRLIDSDDRDENEIKELQGQGVSVLSRRNIESYLFDDEVLAAVCVATGNADKIDAVLAIKAQALKDSHGRGNPADDLKRASGDIHTKMKILLNLQKAGSAPKAFMRSTLAPHLRPGMVVYAELRDSIFGQLAHARAVAE